MIYNKNLCLNAIGSLNLKQFYLIVPKTENAFLVISNKCKLRIKNLNLIMLMFLIYPY